MRSWRLILVLALGACGGRLNTGADGGTDGSSGSPDGGACNAVAIFGDTVTMNNDPATFAGGVGDPPPSQATYVLQGATRYTGPGGASGVVETLSATVQVTSGSWQVALVENGGPTQHRTYRLDHVMGDVYRLVGVCGTTDANDVSFVPINSLGFVMVVHNKDKSDIVELFRPLMK
jgi:hypothetical protein